MFTDFPQRLEELLSGNIEKLQGQIDDIDEKIKNTEVTNQEEQYIKLKKKMRKIVQKGFNAIVLITFKDKDDIYQISGRKNDVGFKKGWDFLKTKNPGENPMDNKEFTYKTLDELYEAEDVDSICLKRDWKNIRIMKIFKVLESENTI